MSPNTPQEADVAAPAGDKAVKSILIYMAMAAEAAPLVNSLDLQLKEHDSFPAGSPWQLHSGSHAGVSIHLVTPGKDRALGVDNVGTVPAAVAVYAAAASLHPDLIINAGTAGGFKAKGAAIGDVYVASHFANHDRRIPLPGFDEYGIGLIESPHASRVASALGFKVGRVSSGNSLDMSAEDEKLIAKNDATVKDMEDEKLIAKNDATVKDMEIIHPYAVYPPPYSSPPFYPSINSQAAAVAWVAALLSLPLLSVKAVTDIVDGDRPTTEEFLENLHTAADALQHAVPKVVALVEGKRLVEL
ncbi:unnamed protein product [Closterium sp. Naga37s-1]|nr:unnamed protein product [Closterium sp. Naga37s-1]